MRRLPLTVILLSTTALAFPALADTSLDELKARFAQAEKENLRLKTEKLERENLTMKTEALEAENAKLRADATKPSAAQTLTTSPKAKQVHAVATSTREITAHRVVNDALASMPKDDPRREMTASAQVVPASTVPPVVQNWSGVYAGINAGYGTGEVSSWSNGPYIGSPFSTDGSLAYSMGSSSTMFNGPVVGGQIGYNHQFSNKIIVGVETDMDYADINNKLGNSNANTRTTLVGSSISLVNNQYGRNGIDWLGTARLRLGYSLGSFMPYVTGGLAYGGVSTSGYSTNYQGQSYGGGTGSFQTGSVGGANNSSVQIGWAAGAGGELKVADSWSIRGEYLYTQLSSLSTGSGSSSFTRNYCSTCTPTTTVNNGGGWGQGGIGPFGIHQARIGVNYYTGWGASSAIVAAKY